MRLLHAGIDTTVIALWLGREQVETTQMYLHADLALKERALARTKPLDCKPGATARRTRSSDSWMDCDEAAVDQGLVGDSSERAPKVPMSNGAFGVVGWPSLLTRRISGPLPSSVPALLPRGRGYRAGRLLGDSGRSGSWPSAR
jgi:hypothetical protein